LEMKISGNKNSEISFVFDNQIKDPYSKEGSVLHAKVTMKCTSITKMVVDDKADQGRYALFELHSGKTPGFYKQTRSNASVKKPKWTTVSNTEGTHR
jgi:hypothetical protein